MTKIIDEIILNQFVGLSRTSIFLLDVVNNYDIPTKHSHAMKAFM